MDGVKKLHLVAWEIIFLLIEWGGLGVRNVREKNITALCKWFWRFRECRICVEVFKEKYGEEHGGFFPKPDCGPLGVSVWRCISKVGDLLRCLTKFQLGSGHVARFWNDI